MVPDYPSWFQLDPDGPRGPASVALVVQVALKALMTTMDLVATVATLALVVLVSGCTSAPDDPCGSGDFDCTDVGPSDPGRRG